MFSVLIAFAAAAAAAPTVTPPAATKSDDPVVCQQQESEVGTHMRPKKVCMKKSEWEFLDHNTKNTLNSINNSGNDRERFTPIPR